jgi:hypothetical protein
METLGCHTSQVGSAVGPARGRRPLVDLRLADRRRRRGARRSARQSRVALRVRTSAPVAYVAIKLCDVFPDGPSALITRGMLNLTHRGCWPVAAGGTVGRAPEPVPRGEWVDVEIELEATTWALADGHVLRLTVAGTDWPNCWPPPQQATIEVDRSTVRLLLPVVDGLAESTHRFGPAGHQLDRCSRPVRAAVSDRVDRGYWQHLRERFGSRDGREPLTMSSPIGARSDTTDSADSTEAGGGANSVPTTDDSGALTRHAAPDGPPSPGGRVAIAIGAAWMEPSATHARVRAEEQPSP